MPADRALILDLRAAMAAAGNPEKAVAQQAYMKSGLPFHGIASPDLKRLLRPRLAAYAPTSRAEHEATVRTLWDEATHREEWYAAIALARHRSVRQWSDVAAMPLWSHLVTTGAWWDVVDEISAHLVGQSLAAHPTEVTPVVREWATAEDSWLRRSAVLCQLRFKEATDLDLLRFAIDSNVDDPSFWLRKAIGWALREQARTDPAWVLGEVARHGDRMSGLSRREATKHLG